jgi:hypothetical protein
VLLRILIIVMLALLAGCERADALAPKERMADRVQRSQEFAAQSPKVTHHATSAGELIVIEVPIALPHGLTDTQHCYVWRDTELRSASMTCPSEFETGPGRSE